MNTEALIKRIEQLESIKDNSGGTFNEVFTEAMAKEFMDLLTTLASRETPEGTVEWRGRHYRF